MTVRKPQPQDEHRGSRRVTGFGKAEYLNFPSDDGSHLFRCPKCGDTVVLTSFWDVGDALPPCHTCPEPTPMEEVKQEPEVRYGSPPMSRDQVLDRLHSVREAEEAAS